MDNDAIREISCPVDCAIQCFRRNKGFSQCALSIGAAVDIVRCMYQAHDGPAHLRSFDLLAVDYQRQGHLTANVEVQTLYRDLVEDNIARFVWAQPAPGYKMWQILICGHPGEKKAILSKNCVSKSDRHSALHIGERADRGHHLLRSSVHI